MFLYYLWAVTEKTLSYVPQGDKLYQFVGYLARKGSKGTEPCFVNSFRMIRKANELVPPGGTVVDVGTGWFHHDAFLLWLTGEYRIYIFDVVDKAKLVYIRNYLCLLRKNVDLLVEELHVDKDETLRKMEALLRFEDRESIYEACNFVPCITMKTGTPFLPEDSVDFMISSCVLCHVPPDILVPELASLCRMLKPCGRMYILIGHEDDMAFHDRSVNIFNYYRYSNKYYSTVFESSFQYQNRLVKQEWFDVFERTGFKVEEYYAETTGYSKEQIAALSHIDARFARYPHEDLAITHSYFLLGK